MSLRFYAEDFFSPSFLNLWGRSEIRTISFHRAYPPSATCARKNANGQVEDLFFILILSSLPKMRIKLICDPKYFSAFPSPVTLLWRQACARDDCSVFILHQANLMAIDPQKNFFSSHNPKLRPPNSLDSRNFHILRIK